MSESCAPLKRANDRALELEIICRGLERELESHVQAWKGFDELISGDERYQEVISRLMVEEKIVEGEKYVEVMKALFEEVLGHE